MATNRTNRFANQSAGLGSMIGAGASDGVTKTIIIKSEQTPEPDTPIPTAETIRYAKPESIDSLFIPFYDQKLRLELLTGERYDRLKESIERNGILDPVICTEYHGKLMIIAGHNRADIAKRLKINLPYIVRTGLTEEEMNLICTDTNILNRQLDDYKPSQLAYALKIKRQAETKQGRRTDLMSELEKQQLLSSDSYHLSTMQMTRYIKLNDLIEPLLNLVDDGKVTIGTGYQIAFFPKTTQEVFLEYITEIRSDKPVALLRKELSQKNITEEPDITNYVKTRIPELCIKSKQKHVTDYRNLKPYIPSSIKPAEVESYIIRALKAYMEHQNE